MSRKTLSQRYSLRSAYVHSGLKRTSRGWLICAAVPLWRDLIPVRRLDSEQMMNEEILQQSLTVGSARAVPAAGNKEQIELFVGLDQGIDNLQRRRRIDVGVHLAQDQQ